MQHLPKVSAVAIKSAGSVRNGIANTENVCCLTVKHSEHELLVRCIFSVCRDDINPKLPCFFCYTGNGIFAGIHMQPARKLSYDINQLVLAGIKCFELIMVK